MTDQPPAQGEAAEAAELVRAHAEEDDVFYNYIGGREHVADAPYRGVYLNAWIGSELVGSVVYGHEDGATWVYHIYVRPEHRGRGIGRQLCGRVADEASRAGRRIDGDFTDADGTLKDYMNSLLG